MGTLTGLLAKYILDRNYIFGTHSATVSQDARRFGLYTVMGIITTLVFWGTEWAFAELFTEPWVKYLGGAIGLTVGYLLKYQLDRRWVFRPTTVVK
jgi:putative flippase GtrA